MDQAPVIPTNSKATQLASASCPYLNSYFSKEKGGAEETTVDSYEDSNERASRVPYREPQPALYYVKDDILSDYECLTHVVPHTSLAPPHVPCRFNYPDDGVDQ